MTEKNQNKTNTHNKSRRTFLKNSGMVVGGIVIGGAVGNIIGLKKTTPVSKPITHTSQIDYTETLHFFKRQEDFETLAAAVERIFPEDELGPGAIGLGVPYFIDKQLATPWGQNSEEYRKFPFNPGEANLNRGDLFIAAMRKINELSNEKYQNNFKNIEIEEQIEILTMFEKGEVQIEQVNSAIFFATLRQSTLEGCYSDPMYGGNKNMDGWKMKEFPGSQHSYMNKIENEFKIIPPNSIKGHHS